jgi:superfamily II DNA/RNA helicase
MIEKEGTSNLTHPKIDRLISLIKEEIEVYKNKKFIIFTQYREMAEFLKNRLLEIFSNQLNIEKFIGQSMKMDDMGYSQPRQIEILNDFRVDKIDILIATSVAEEGLDIPNVDSIVFYEPVPSEIRLIQRRGRTGRFAEGRCYILITDNTIDVPFYEVALRKEDTMNTILLNPEQLSLVENINRLEIDFSSMKSSCSGLDFLSNFRKRKEREKELLADRSIEEIISELDNFKLTDEYKRLRECGVSFYSDVIKIDKSKLKQNMLKIKGKKKDMTEKKRKRYINNNVKTLINIARLYSKNGKIALSEFKELASEEDIIEKKFWAHYGQACYLGYLKKAGNYVQFIKEYD